MQMRQTITRQTIMSGKKMSMFFFLAVVSLSMATPLRNRRQLLPCNHLLRISAPELFSHCLCDYSPWGDWEDVPGSTQSAPTSQCASGQTFMQRRTRTVTQGSISDCKEVTETRRVCVPDTADKLIMALGLGSSGQDLSPVSGSPSPGLPTPRGNATVQWNPNTGRYDFRRTRRQTLPSRGFGLNRRCPRIGGGPPQQICRNLAGKRSALFANEQGIDNVEGDLDAVAADSLLEDLPSNYHDDNAVMQFSFEEHGRRFRRQIRPEECSSRDIQNVLFVFDSSGSIGRTDYDRMKEAVAKLTPVFCRRVKFALMTFSSNMNLEFCFDCFENTFNGRRDAAAAIRKAVYQSGGTKTGEAARCICDDIFNPSCGISSNPSCTDVVFITDGQSNGNLDVCQTIRCLHQKRGVNTFSIGIGNFQNFQAELDCIDDGKDRLSAFEFNSFDDFEAAIDEVIRRLALLIPTNPLSCAALYGIPPPPPPPSPIPIDLGGGIPIGRK